MIDRMSRVLAQTQKMRNENNIFSTAWHCCYFPGRGGDHRIRWSFLKETQWVAFISLDRDTTKHPCLVWNLKPDPTEQELGAPTTIVYGWPLKINLQFICNIVVKCVFTAIFDRFTDLLVCSRTYYEVVETTKGRGKTCYPNLDRVSPRSDVRRNCTQLLITNQYIQFRTF